MIIHLVSNHVSDQTLWTIPWGMLHGVDTDLSKLVDMLHCFPGTHCYKQLPDIGINVCLSHVGQGQ